jgi:hypothetical protein
MIISDNDNKYILTFDDTNEVLKVLKYSNTSFNPSKGEFDKELSDTFINGGQSVYGSFYSSSMQSNASSINVMSFPNTFNNHCISVIDNTKITPKFKGIYNIQFSAQVEKTDSGSDNIEIWFRKNGVNIPNSNTRVNIDGNSAKLVASWNFIEMLDNQYLEICWYSADTNMRLYAESSGARPAIASVIVTCTLV